ncbi:uncharacterized protein FTOL_00800 [Fusarium torulosum]|uniref:Uncharacterized protein n=1 Tax=Fusarium torulosum TaxID=33205 RepID=A0AAE8SD16_9HYPO|nr:uncharacterized protein FTOL_00800 [Fusarium torulosum]
MTEDYHCESLKDYEEALETMAKGKGLKSKKELSESQVKELCRNQDTAEEYDFTGLEWMPLRKNGMDPDPEFDLESLMLYPSGGDGKDPEDKRPAVLMYPGEKPMPIKKGSSGMDIKKLLKLYGINYRGTSRLHNDNNNKFKGLLKKVRSKWSLRAGDTEKGTC